VVEGARLESVYTRKGIAGSNPALSARSKRCPRQRRGILFVADGTSLLGADAENKMISERSERTSFRS
jgi:hypothetical protein